MSPDRRRIAGPRPGRPDQPFPPPRRPGTFRWGAILLIPALLIGAGLIDQAEDRPTSGVSVAGLGPASWLPTAFPAKAVGSAWYCAGGTAAAGANANHEVYLFNPSDRSLTATVTAYPSKGDPKDTVVSVAARMRVVVRLAELVDAPYAAASVESTSSRLIVQQRVSGSLGYDLAACSNRAGSTWYFPGGSTAFGNDEVLAIFNPFAADATVNISFVTDSAELDARTRSPQAFQGMAVPGRSLVVARVTDKVSRQNNVVATVQATSGSVVVDQLQAFGGDLQPAPTGGTGSQPGDGTGSDVPPEAKPNPGLTLHPGVPVAATRWAFPDGRKADGARESVLVYNPSGQAADVDIGVVLSPTGATGPVPPVAPIEITGLGSNEFQIISIADETRVPAGVDHTITVRSLKGVPVIAQRLLTGASPWDHSGAAAVTGSPVMAKRWLLATGSALPTVTQDIAVFNPTKRPATVTATFLDSGKPVTPATRARVVVPPGGRATLSLPALGLPATDLGTIVSATGPVVVEQSLLEGGGQLGLSSTIATPLPEDLAPLPG